MAKVCHIYGGCPKSKKYIILILPTLKVAEYATYIVPITNGQNMPFIWCFTQKCHNTPFK